MNSKFIFYLSMVMCFFSGTSGFTQDRPILPNEEFHIGINSIIPGKFAVRPEPGYNGPPVACVADLKVRNLS